jgi:hypothetical protein
MNSEQLQYDIGFSKEGRHVFSEKGKAIVGKVTVSPRGPTRLRPSYSSTLHILPLSLSLSPSHTHSFGLFSQLYSRDSTAYSSAEQKAVTVKWDEVSEQE